MLKMIHHWEIGAIFVDVFVKFRDQPQVFEESFRFFHLCPDKKGSFGQQIGGFAIANILSHYLSVIDMGMA